MAVALCTLVHNVCCTFGFRVCVCVLSANASATAARADALEEGGFPDCGDNDDNPRRHRYSSQFSWGALSERAHALLVRALTHASSARRRATQQRTQWIYIWHIRAYAFTPLVNITNPYGARGVPCRIEKDTQCTLTVRMLDGWLAGHRWMDGMYDTAENAVRAGLSNPGAIRHCLM